MRAKGAATSAHPFNTSRDIAGDTPKRVTVTSDRVFDFGFVVEGARTFSLVLPLRPNDFQGDLWKDQVLRYFLQIDADNFVSPKLQVFEVGWDGQWSFEPEKMEHYLTLREIANA
jgi:hypothetical protein